MNTIKPPEANTTEAQTGSDDNIRTRNILTLLPALPLAEDLDADQLLEATEAETTRTITSKSRLRESERQFRLGCLSLERGLLRGTSQREAHGLFENAQQHFDQGLEIEDSAPRVAFKIGYTAASMPFFRERKTGVEATTEEAEQAWYDIGALAGNAKQYEGQPQRRLDILCTTGVPLFLLRKNVRVYSTTFRESQFIARTETNKAPSFVHNSYTIPDGSKLAIRTTHNFQEKTISNIVVPIPFGKFIRSRIDQMWPDKFSHVTPKAFTTAIAMDLAIRESRGAVLKSKELALLDNISEAIQWRLFRYSSRRASQ